MLDHLDTNIDLDQDRSIIAKPIVFPPPPPTTNVLTPEQRAQLLRRTQKIARIFGTTPRFVDVDANADLCGGGKGGRSASASRERTSLDSILSVRSSTSNPMLSNKQVITRAFTPPTHPLSRSSSLGSLRSYASGSTQLPDALQRNDKDAPCLWLTMAPPATALPLHLLPHMATTTTSKVKANVVVRSRSLPQEAFSAMQLKHPRTERTQRSGEYDAAYILRPTNASTVGGNTTSMCARAPKVPPGLAARTVTGSTNATKVKAAKTSAKPPSPILPQTNSNPTSARWRKMDRLRRTLGEGVPIALVYPPPSACSGGIETEPWRDGAGEIGIVVKDTNGVLKGVAVTARTGKVEDEQEKEKEEKEIGVLKVGMEEGRDVKAGRKEKEKVKISTNKLIKKTKNSASPVGPRPRSGSGSEKRGGSFLSRVWTSTARSPSSPTNINISTTTTTTTTTSTTITTTTTNVSVDPQNTNSTPQQLRSATPTKPQIHFQTQTHRVRLRGAVLCSILESPDEQKHGNDSVGGVPITVPLLVDEKEKKQRVTAGRRPLSL